MSPSVSVRLLLTQSDARLLAFARTGHERAFEALVQRYRRQLLGNCRRLLLSEERAEDALQQALLQAWLALRAGTEVADAKPWLYRIVHNAALNALRVSGYDYCKLSESLSGAGAPQEDLDRRIAVREALAGLAALPEMQREALLRTAVEGRTHQQVARDLGLSEDALRGLVYRARAALRTAVGAITPPPLVSWALGSGGRGAPVVERLAELGAGGGSAGVAGLLLKGGAAAVTASVLAGGIAAVHPHPRPAHRPSRAAHRLAHPDDAPPAVAASRSASVTAIPATRQPSDGKPSSTDRPLPRLKRISPQASTGLPRAGIAPAPPSAPSNDHPPGGWEGRSGGGDGGRTEARGPAPSGAGWGETATGSGEAGKGARHAEQSSSAGAGSSGHDSQGGGGSPGSAGVSSSGVSPSGVNSSGVNPAGGSSGDGRDGGTSGGEDGASTSPTRQLPESRDGQVAPSTSTAPTSSSKEGQSPTPKG
jgi:RNA polymerase sigma factor (sigma-70 family)